ncbi:hypothetical protein F5Y15DRAFT_418121 [Xylariaceae sp. FL0016]|nr:hypothetical protein F5Y15DRAFT_418121 [Xylariaceae sp. FL0016]
MANDNSATKALSDSTYSFKMPVAWFNQNRQGEETTEGTTPIPEPPGLPLLGNVADIDPELPLRSFTTLAEKYGEIYRLRLPGRTAVIASSHRLIDELCDERRFVKIPRAALDEIRHGVHDGLFTARPEEPNWGIAHRILMPAYVYSQFRYSCIAGSKEDDMSITDAG